MFEIYVTLVFLVVLWGSFSRKRYLPPGPFPFPFIGNLPQLAVNGGKVPFVAFDNLAKKYGDIMTIRLGSTDVVVLTGYNVMKEVLGKDEWSGKVFEESLKTRYLNQRLGILFLEGEAWKDQRRFLLRHLRDLGFGKQNSMESFISVELNELTSHIRQKMADGRQTVVYMHNYFNLSVVNVLWTMIAGVRYAHDDEKLLTLMEHLHTLMKSSSVGGLSTMFPILRKIAPKLTGEEQQLDAYTTLQNFLRELIREKRHSEDYELPKSFLDIYLQEIDKFQGDPSSFYTEDQLVMLCFDMFLAGSETTSNSLCFALLYMMVYPEIQEKVYDEVLDVLGANCDLRMEHKNKLPYTSAVLMETLRCCNVAPLTIPHAIMENDANYKDYIIPKDTLVFINLYSVHMNEMEWKDPESFKPERFLTKEGKILKNDNLIPFGIGKHTCLGESLATTTLFLYFTTLIKHFKFETVPGHLNPSVEPVVGFTLSPKPFNAVITKR